MTYYKQKYIIPKRECVKCEKMRRVNKMFPLTGEGYLCFQCFTKVLDKVKDY